MMSNNVQRAALARAARLQARLRRLHRSNRKMVRKWGRNGPAETDHINYRLWIELALDYS